MALHKNLSNNELSILICAGLLAILAIGLVAAALLFDAQDKAYLFATFTEEHVRMLGMFDNRGQQMAYRILLIVTGAFAVAAWYVRPYSTALAAPVWLFGLVYCVRRYSGFVLLVVLLMAFLIQYKLQPGSNIYNFQGRYGIGFIPSGQIHLVLMVFGAVGVYLASMPLKGKLTLRVAAFLGIPAALMLAVYVSSVFFYGILQQPNFHDFTPGLLVGIEWHYAGSVASADRLAFGDRIGTVSIHAGLLPSALMAYLQTTFGALDFSEHIRFIAWLQLCFFVAAVAAYAKWYRGRWLPIIIAILLILPWVAPVHAAILYPNQSAWRFLGLGFGTLALVYLHARPVHDIAIPLGFAAGLALLWNLETGFALMLAFMGFLVVRTSPDSGSIKQWWIILRFALGLAVALLCFLCFVRFAFGYWADPVGIIKSFPLLGGFAKGYGGLQLRQVDPLAAMIFIHALYALVRGVVHWGSGAPVGARRACEMALAGLILVWGAYYFKGPHFWNLWSYKFLYGFFLGSLLVSHWPNKRWRCALFIRSARLVALSLVILPAIITANLLTIRSLNLAVRQAPCMSGDVVSGLCLSGELAQVVRQKAETLGKLNAREPLLFLSANSYLMPLLTGINQPLPMRDAFSETILKSDFDRLIKDILLVRPTRLLFDDPDSVVSGYPAHRSFYGRVRAAISAEYVLEGTVDGWEVWRSRFMNSPAN